MDRPARTGVRWPEVGWRGVVTLFARVSTFQGPVDGLDVMTRQARESVIPAARQMTGYQGILFLGDRWSGKSIAVTLWESEAAMRESEEAANKLRAQTSEGGEDILSVERFEVLVDERNSFRSSPRRAQQPRGSSQA